MCRFQRSLENVRIKSNVPFPLLLLVAAIEVTPMGCVDELWRGHLAHCCFCFSSWTVITRKAFAKSGTSDGAELKSSIPIPDGGLIWHWKTKDHTFPLFKSTLKLVVEETIRSSDNLTSGKLEGWFFLYTVVHKPQRNWADTTFTLQNVQNWHLQCRSRSRRQTFLLVLQRLRCEIK